MAHTRFSKATLTWIKSYYRETTMALSSQVARDFVPLPLSSEHQYLNYRRSFQPSLPDWPSGRGSTMQVTFLDGRGRPMLPGVPYYSGMVYSRAVSSRLASLLQEGSPYLRSDWEERAQPSDSPSSEMSTEDKYGLRYNITNEICDLKQARKVELEAMARGCHGIDYSRPMPPSSGAARTGETPRTTRSTSRRGSRGRSSTRATRTSRTGERRARSRRASSSSAPTPRRSL